MGIVTEDTLNGIHGTASSLIWTEAYLTGRSQRVRISNTESREMDLKHGVLHAGIGLGSSIFLYLYQPNRRHPETPQAR